MRRFVTLAILGLLLGAGLVTLIEQDPGYVFVSVGDITVETSIWFALLLWLLAWAVLVLVFRVLGRLLRTRRAFSGWLGGRKARNAAALTNRGLINFIEGHWERARKQLLRAARYSEAPLINHLIAAQASYRMGDHDETRRQLGMAESVEAGAGIALELTQAELQLSDGRYEQALATLVRARNNANKHPYVLELLARAHRQLGDWQSLRGLLPELHKHSLLTAPGLIGLEGEVWAALLNGSSSDGPQDVQEIEKLWQAMPAHQREDDSLRVCYVNRLIKLESYVKAERLLIDMLDKQWSQSLVLLVGTFPPVNSKKLLKAINRWLESQGGEPQLLLAAGRVALFAEAWPQAGKWLEDAYKAEPSIASCAELARWRTSQGDIAAANDLWRQAAMLSVGVLPPTPMPEARIES